MFETVLMVTYRHFWALDWVVRPWGINKSHRDMVSFFWHATCSGSPSLYTSIAPGWWYGDPIATSTRKSTWKRTGRAHCSAHDVAQGRIHGRVEYALQGLCPTHLLCSECYTGGSDTNNRGDSSLHWIGIVHGCQAMEVALFDISIWNIDCWYIDTFEKYRYR